MLRIAAILALALFAVIPAARADDLDDGWAACKPHAVALHPGLVSQQKLWEPGWEHCQPIREAWVKRDAAAAVADEAKNPALKATRALAKKLDGSAK